MQIQFPRRVQLGFRPWYGLTLRQLGYLVVAGVVAGGIVLFGPAEGGGLVTRVLIGLAIISVGVALAFFRKDGLTTEQWVLTQFKFLLRPHERVWTRGESGSARDQIAEILIDGDAQSSEAKQKSGIAEDTESKYQHLLRPTAPGPSASPAVVFIDMAVLLSFFSLVVYLSRGGLAEMQGWLAIQVGR